jgi:hypothetical protein
MKSFADVLRDVEALPVGTPIPKPMSADNSKLVRWGKRRSEQALIYSMPNHKNPSKPHEKGVTISELNQAYNQLTNVGSFSRRWFNENMADCKSEGSCNFTTIGGVFQLVGVGEYESAGRYCVSSSMLNPKALDKSSSKIEPPQK